MQTSAQERSKKLSLPWLAEAARQHFLRDSTPKRRVIERAAYFDWESDQDAWLAEQFQGLTKGKVTVSPSQWAEQNRYLPRSVTTMPGRFRFDIAPYFREIVDSLDPLSPIQHVTLMKGVQVGATVNVLENLLGYCIAYMKTAPVMLVTADKELAQLRMDSYVVPMLQNSKLAHLIKSGDMLSTRKSGKTDQRIEWVGGGFLVPMGAQNANKARSISIQVLLADEVDGWPVKLGKDGDSYKLFVDRTAAFEQTRKIAVLSTPLEKETSKVYKLYLKGDQRKYFVCCLKCGEAQTLAWRRTDPDTGEVSGITWQTDDEGNLVPGSSRYVCKACGHAHRNEDKVKLLDPKHGAHWRPTATSADPKARSYHLSALYSPVGVQSWDTVVRNWLDAWDVENNRAKDVEALQTFYNNMLGLPFEQRGERVTFQIVSLHRRDYHYGEVPNQLANKYSGSDILLVTGAVDVHKSDLAVAVLGWTRGRRCYVLDYWRFPGDTEHLTDESWMRLRELIETKFYDSRDYRYRIALSLIDSGYRTEQVYQFAAEYASGVYPIKGQDMPPKSARIKEFSDFATPMGTPAYGVTVDIYKERWSAALRQQWDGLSMQPLGHFNAPRDMTDKQLKELTVETKRAKVHATTGVRIGWEWYRPSNANNELWDLLVYNNAALDLIAWDICRNQLEQDFVSWNAFYDLCERGNLFREPISNDD